MKYEATQDKEASVSYAIRILQHNKFQMWVPEAAVFDLQMS